MNKPKLCVAGSSNVDLVTTVKRMPQPGETLMGSAFNTFFGGKGANQAVMAAKLGAEVTMISRIGTDSFGDQYYENYRENGLILDYILRTAEVPTGIAAITVDDSGQNAIIVYGGANQRLKPADVDLARPAIQAAGTVVSQLEIPLETTLRFLQIARESGVPTVFNPAPAHELTDDFFAVTDYFCPNETEASLMAGMAVESFDDAERAAKIFLKRGAKAVVITMGSRGAFYKSANDQFQVPAEMVKAVDTTGAGDAFIGTMAYFIAAGAPIRTAMLNASHAAALSVQKMGAQPSYPPYDECDFSDFNSR